MLVNERVRELTCTKKSLRIGARRPYSQKIAKSEWVARMLAICVYNVQDQLASYRVTNEKRQVLQPAASR
jgi:hypothetical protein